MERKPLYWVASTLDNLSAFPTEVKEIIGYALHLAQIGQKHQRTKRMQGKLRGVFEIVDDFQTDTYRAMYTIKPRGIYCLHAFKKKSKKGTSTPSRELELITKRLQEIKDEE